MSTDWLITGIPRSGTTLLAALIDSMPDSVCLNEPLWQQNLAKSSRSADEFVLGLEQDVARLRGKLRHGEPIFDLRHEDGSPVTNYLNERGEVVVRPVLFSRANLPDDFIFAIKHNGLYLGVLPQLAACRKFRIIAVIRHPLEVLASWRSSSLPVSRGELPAASYFWGDLLALTQGPIDILDKQLHLIEALYKRIHEHEQYLTLLRYESLADDPKLLSTLFGKIPEGYDFYISKQAAKPMDAPLDLVRKKLKDIGHYTRYYYPDF